MYSLLRVSLQVKLAQDCYVYFNVIPSDSKQNRYVNSFSAIGPDSIIQEWSGGSVIIYNSGSMAAFVCSQLFLKAWVMGLLTGWFHPSFNNSNDQVCSLHLQVEWRFNLTFCSLLRLNLTWFNNIIICFYNYSKPKTVPCIKI